MNNNHNHNYHNDGRLAIAHLEAHPPSFARIVPTVRSFYRYGLQYPFAQTNTIDAEQTDGEETVAEESDEEDEDDAEEDEGSNPDELVGEFRNFLDSIRPEDFSS